MKGSGTNFCPQGEKKLYCQFKLPLLLTCSWTVSPQATHTYLYSKCELLLVCQIVRG